MAQTRCSLCEGELIEIDRFGERLVGCVVCNIWRWRSSPSVSMALPEANLAALRKRVGTSAEKKRRPPLYSHCPFLSLASLLRLRTRLRPLRRLTETST